jgi:hypothetical protein
VPNGQISTLDAKKAKSLAAADVVSQAASQKSQPDNSPASMAISALPPSDGGKSGYRPTQIEDLSLATLNSILFE